VVVRKDSKVDAFHRQISALRHQLGGEQHDLALPAPVQRQTARTDNAYRSDFAVLDDLDLEPARSTRESLDTAVMAEPEFSLPAIPAADTLTSVIAHTTTWNGSLESSGSLHVHGRVDGSLTAHDDVYVAEEAEVDATITAANVTIAGNVRGTIHCAQRFEVLPRGRVAGDVNAPVVVIHEGAILVGAISMATRAESRGSMAPPTGVSRGGD
jgi:cytoskeletal protein CcmA (bactofilin family)